MSNINNTWDRVLLARHAQRPTAIELIKFLIQDFIELKGDRTFADDLAIIGGIGMLDNIPVTVIGQEKGKDTNEKIKRNFGMPHPEGYRKALRLMQQANKFNRPIITIIDTPGAFPGIGAEERGQAQAIALNLKKMMMLEVPIIVVVLGEGGSGGALAMGVGDKVIMFENAIYSILSPEGFASILFKDGTKAKEAAELMKLTAKDLKELNVIDEIILEGKGLHIDSKTGFNNVKKSIIKHLNALSKTNKQTLLEQRYFKYRKIGVFLESENVTNE